MTKKQKKITIQLFDKILNSYINDTHDTKYCPLCIEYKNKYTQHECSKCPWGVFQPDKEYSILICMSRGIPALHSAELNNCSLKSKLVKLNKQKKLLIELYSKAIPILKNAPMREKSYTNETNSIWSREIKKLIKEILNKH